MGFTQDPCLTMDALHTIVWEKKYRPKVTVGRLGDCARTRRRRTTFTMP